MADQQRKLLEQLMGSTAIQQENVDLNDPHLCRAYCVDYCIYELFSGTRAHFGPCRYTHLERARLLYQAHKADHGPIPSFERAFDSQLKLVLTTRQATIDEQEQKIAPAFEGTDQSAELLELVQLLDSKQVELEAMAQELHILGKCGIIDANLVRMLDSYNMLRGEISSLESQINRAKENLGFSAHLKLVVCKICGSLLSSMEPEVRLADHFTGKLHRSYATVIQSAEKRQNFQS